MSQCVTCGRTLTGAYACDSCLDSIIAGLRQCGWLAAQLTVTRTRQDRLATAGGRGGNDQPLPWHIGARRALDDLHNTLHTWARDLGAEAVDHLHTYGRMADWIAGQRDAIRQHPAADELARDLERVQTGALLVINTDPDEQTYGVCGAELDGGTECGTYLYGAADATWVRCRTCHEQHDTGKRRDWMRRRMETLYLRAATLSRLLSILLPDRPTSDNNIRSWYALGRPINTMLDEQGVITYRVGDVIDVATSTGVRNRKKAS
jgi:hypothetical protein